MSFFLQEFIVIMSKKIPYLDHVVNLNIQFNVVFILRKIKILNAPFGIILMN